MGEEFVGDAPDALGRDIAFAFRPVGRTGRHVVEEELERRLRLGVLVPPQGAVRAALDARRAIAAGERRFADFGVERLVGAVRQVANQRLVGFRIAQIVTVRPDQVGRARVRAQERQVADSAPVALVQDAVNQGIEEGGVGLRFDRQPFRRTGRRDRQMRLDLDPLEPGGARVGLTPGAGHARRILDILAAVDDVVAARRVGRADEGPVPQLAVEMFRMVAFGAGARAVAHVDRAPGGEEGGQRADIFRRRVVAAEGEGEARIA